MVFEFEKKVRFGEIDHAGIVYYPRFFNFYHLAMEEFFEHAVGTPYATVLDEWRIGFPTVSVQAEFTKPLHFGDVTTIRLAVVRLGKSSVRMRYRVHRADGALCAEAQLTTVCVDMDTFRARAIPDKLRKAFLRHAEPDATAAEDGEGSEG